MFSLEAHTSLLSSHAPLASTRPEGPKGIPSGDAFGKRRGVVPGGLLPDPAPELEQSPLCASKRVRERGCKGCVF
jgi:hypothetical protein